MWEKPPVDASSANNVTRPTPTDLGYAGTMSAEVAHGMRHLEIMKEAYIAVRKMEASKTMFEALLVQGNGGTFRAMTSMSRIG